MSALPLPPIQPSLEQQAILAAPLQPMRIAAGAGTGKTTTIALLVHELITERGVAPEEILGLTFTQKAAAELADRIRALAAAAGPGREGEVHTYHGFAAQLVREFGALVGIDRRASVITPTFSRQLLYEILQRRRFEHVDATWLGVVESVQRLGSALGDHLVDTEALISSAGGADPWPARLELLAAWQEYQAEKRRLGVVDYADLISSAVELADYPGVAARVRARYSAVLLDEYQDTNPAQRILLQKIFGAGFPVIAVGDSDQTIYEWRGATPDNFAAFSAHFPKSDGSPATDRKLTLNRRSDRSIVELANRIRAQIGGDTHPLVARPDAGDGFVGVRWATDAVAEADWIADEAVRLHEQGVAWRDMAVLFRKNRHIALVHDALVQRGIPVEVANLGGLLSVPEVADLRAWMRILHSPEDGPALLRILLGPRYRLGLGDLSHLSAWSRRAPHAAAEDEADLDHERLPAHTMLEAIEHLDDITELEARARDALSRFRNEYRRLLTVAQGASLVELARTILDVTGTWQEVEALSASARLSARLNLYRFLDLAEEWSPLEGKPSLAAFLAHLDLMEENPADELDAARLSGEDALAILTVHRAKGLEWDVVFVPAVTKKDFPATPRVYPDPYRRPQFLPHEWRRDTPPPLDAQMSPDEAKAVLREENLRQEWRTAYVAATRARRRLYFSGAHWYGSPAPTQRPSEPSALFELVASTDGVEDLGRDPVPERPEVLRAPQSTPAPDPLFVEGWEAALRRAVDDPGTLTATARELGVEKEFVRRAEEFQERLFELAEVTEDSAATERRATSVSGLVTYAACPRRHYWTEVDRLPRRPSPAARRGVEIHRRIELHGLGHVPIQDLDLDAYDIPEEPDRVAGSDPYAAYLASPYAERRPTLVEAGFQFDTVSGVAVRGRIDAVYADGDGWEIVDFKTGRPRSDPWLDVQLQAYAVAARRVDFGIGPPERLTVTFVYLGDGWEVKRREVDEEWFSDAEATIESIASSIAEGRFEPHPSPACRSCEFVRFCPVGAAWLEAQP